MIFYTVALKNRLPAIMAAGEKGTSEAVETMISDVENGAKEKSRYDTGNMRGGWQSRMIDDNTGEVFNPVHYTIFHEFGTSFMSAQPMLTPSVEESMEKFTDNIKRSWAG